MKYILFLILLIPSIAHATCTTTVGQIPVTTTGSPTPQICDGDITDISGNVGIGSTNPGYTLDVKGTNNRFVSITTGHALCTTASNLLGHCTTTPTNGSCTCVQG